MSHILAELQEEIEERKPWCVGESKVTVPLSFAPFRHYITERRVRGTVEFEIAIRTPLEHPCGALRYSPITRMTRMPGIGESFPQSFVAGSCRAVGPTEKQHGIDHREYTASDSSWSNEPPSSIDSAHHAPGWSTRQGGAYETSLNLIQAVQSHDHTPDWRCAISVKGCGVRVRTKDMWMILTGSNPRTSCLLSRKTRRYWRSKTENVTSSANSTVLAVSFIVTVIDRS